MKTNNIFRTLFMAVLLLAGVSNVEAGEFGLWTQTVVGGTCPTWYDGEYGSIEIPYSDFDKYGATEGFELRVYATLTDDESEGRWKIDLTTPWGCRRFDLFPDWHGAEWGGHNDSDEKSNYDSSNGYFKFTFGDDTMNAIETKGGSLVITFLGLTVTYVELVGEVSSGPKTYNVRIADWVTGGEIKADPEKAKESDIVTLMFTPNDGYKLTWVGVQTTDYKDVEVKAIEDNVYQFTMPASNVTVNASFEEEAKSYSVSVSSTSNGSVTADPTSAKEGEKITLTATPAEGYEFDSWTVTRDDNGGTVEVNGNTFTMPASDVTVSATFVEVSAAYTVTIGEIANGTVTADPMEAKAGTTITLTAVPADGYEFVSWTVTAANGNDITVTDNHFTMPESDVTISAEFKEVEASEPTTYTITIGEIANGTVTADPMEAKAGTTVTLTAVPADGYEFVRWTVTAANGNEITVTDNQFEMPESDVTVSATFEEEQTSTQPTEGTVIWEGSAGNCQDQNVNNSFNFVIGKEKFSTVTPGSKVRIYVSCFNDGWWQFALKSDYHVSSSLWSNWNGHDDWGGQMKDKHNDYSGEYFEYEVSSDGAEYLKQSGLSIEGIGGATITCVTLVLGDAPSGPITYNVNIYQYISNGSVTANPTRAEAGETVTLTITPDTNYELEWLSVKDGNDQDVSVDWRNYTFTMPASSVTVYAGFKQETTEPTYYNVSISTTGNGSVSANPSSATEGTTVTLYVSPYDGYELDGLSVKDGNNNDVSVNWSNCTFTMPASNVTVYATFKEKSPDLGTVTATISSTGYATFCSDKALDFSTVSGLKAYYAQSISGGYVALVQVTGTVAAGTGLVLVGSSASIPVVSSGSEISGNLLKGVLYDSETINSANCYVLTVENGQVKFASTVSHSAEIPAGHAYLRSSSSYSRLAIKISGETTGIEDMVLPDSQEEEVYYDLRGMRVAQPTRGIYIVNGKKVFVK